MKAIVLAAGKGTRLIKTGEDFPKAMKPMKGKPLLSYVLNALSFIEKKDINIVVGYKKEKIIENFADYTFVVQEQQLGTGHAVKVCESKFSDYDGPVLVAFGDMPMIKSETYQKMLEGLVENKADCMMLTVITERKLPYGRIIRAENGEFIKITEQKDCNEKELLINELNPSVYAFNSKGLFSVLGKLKNNNSQSEYYLTDVPSLMKESGMKVITHTIRDDVQVLGVNDENDLKLCEQYL